MIRRTVAVAMSALALAAACSQSPTGAPSSDARAPALASTATGPKFPPIHRGRQPIPHAATPRLTGGGPTIPASWTIANWWLDPANSTGCASDANNCTASCGGGGVGPCLHYSQILSRWGTDAPRLPQTTTVTYLSNQAAAVDPIDFEGSLTAGSNLIFTGPLTHLPSPTTFTLDQAKNRTLPATGTPGGGLLQVTFNAPVTPGTLIENTTAGKSSRAFVYANNGGGAIAVMTQPIATPGAPVTAPMTPAEVDTWATGDTVSAVQLVNVNVTAIHAAGGDQTSTAFPLTGSIVELVGLHVLDLSGTAGTSGLSPSDPDGSVTLVDSWVDPVLMQGGTSFDIQGPVNLADCYCNGGAFLGVESTFYAGCVTPTAVDELAAGPGVALDGDAIFGGGMFTLESPVLVANVAIPPGQTCFVDPNGAMYIETLFTAPTQPHFWGNFTMGMFAGASVFLSQSAGVPTWASALFTAAINGMTTPSTYAHGTPGVWNDLVGAVTPAALDAAPGHAIVDPLQGIKFSPSL